MIRSVTFIVILYAEIFFAQTADTIYVPLHLGNRWQYLVVGGMGYQLSESEVYADTLINDTVWYKVNDDIFFYSIAEKKLYVFWNGTAHLYVDFTVPNGQTYVSFSHGMYATVWSESGVNNIFGIERSYGGYLYTGPGQSAVRQRYSDSLGMTYQKVAITGVVDNSDLISAIICDSSGCREYSDGYKPVFQITPLTNINSTIFDLTFLVNHHFTHISYPGLDFMDSVMMVSYYSNGDTIIYPTPIPVIHSSIASYRVNFVIDTMLMKNNYSFYYRFIAKDKCMVPGFSSAPDTGYFKCIWESPANTEDEIVKPNLFNLEQNYPNPFNPSTTIKYEVPEPCIIILTVYDVLGNEIAVLDKGEKVSGVYEVNFPGENLSSGLYFYQLKSDKFLQTRKMILLK